MRVRIKSTISGTRNGQDWPPVGAETELPDVEAAELCRSGLAEPVAVTATPERAVVTAPVERRAT